MLDRLNSRFAAFALAWPLLASASFAAAEPLEAGAARRTINLDDVLAMETFGAVALSPDGRRVIYERRRPYDTATRFDRAHRSG